MGQERPIERGESEILDAALSEQHSIERVARRWIGLDANDGVSTVDRQNGQPDSFHVIGDVVQSHAGVELAEPGLDRDFP